MQLQQPFNANAVDPTQGGNYQQLPAGKHPVIIVASEVKATSDNTGGMVVFELQVTDGPAKGASGPMRINLYNASDKARQIAEAQMSALCHATGVFMLQDTQQLHGIPFAVDVTEQPLTPQQVEKQQKGEKVTPFTQVSKILTANGELPGVQGGQQSQPQQSAPAQGNGGGWGQGTQQNSPSPAPAPAQGNGGWGGSQQSQPPAQAPAPAQQGNAGWQQNAGNANGKPAWGR